MRAGASPVPVQSGLNGLKANLFALPPSRIGLRAPAASPGEPRDEDDGRAHEREGGQRGERRPHAEAPVQPADQPRPERAEDIAAAAEEAERPPPAARPQARQPARHGAAHDDPHVEDRLVDRERRRPRLDVPHQAAVLGTDDAEIICDNASPRLSSIRFVTERQGALVARELEKLMDGTSRGPNLLPWTYHVLVPRESTSPVAPAAQLIRRALALIDRRATTGLSVKALAHELGVSRRLLELRFRQFKGARLAHASVRLSWRCERDVEQGS